MEKKSILDRLMNVIGESVPTRIELKTQKTKAQFKILLLTLCILLVASVIIGVISIYILGFFLRLFGTILTFGTASDFRHQRRQNRHFDERGRYF